MIPQYSQPGVQVFPDGREVCDLRTEAGKAVYKDRKREMWDRQGRICCLAEHAPMCPGMIRRFVEVSFEHESGKGSGGGKRDDRIEVEGRWQNGASHYVCNNWKGSRRIDYNAAIQRAHSPATL